MQPAVLQPSHTLPSASLSYFLTVEKHDVRPEAQESCLGPILSLSLEEFSSPGYDIVYDTSQWHVGESRGSARGFRRHSPRLPAYELMRKTGHAFKDSHQGHCGFGSEIGFRLHGGQSYVLGRCLPDHQGTIISIDCIILLFCIRLDTCAQADSLKTSGGVLLLPSMATLHERLRLQASAMPTRQHSAVMQSGTDDEVPACLPFLFACLACLPCSLASLLKQVLFVTMCS